MDKFDVDKQYLMCREGFLSHDLLQATTGQSMLIVWHHYEISIYILIAFIIKFGYDARCQWLKERAL